MTGLTGSPDRTFNLPDGLTLNVAISNVSTYAPGPAPMNSYFAASPLSNLYDFTNRATTSPIPSRRILSSDRRKQNTSM